MNKKLKTVLFLIIATIVNMALFVAVFILLLFLFSRFLTPSMAPETRHYAIIGLFVLSAIGVFPIYGFLTKIIGKIFPFEQHLDPIFRPKRRKKL